MCCILFYKFRNMKKLQIFTLCSAIILWWIFLVNAKDLTNPKTAISSKLNIERWSSNLELITWSHASANLTWATTSSEENNWQYSCDLNSDKEINIADINRFNSYCSVSNSQNPSKCDINKDWEFNVADMNVIYYNCINEIMWSKNTCDFDDNWKNDISDITRFIDNCYLSQKGWHKCDINNNWKFDISDITSFINDCIYWMLWTNTNNSTNTDWLDSSNSSSNNWKFSCDLNKDNESNIIDISLFNSHCSAINWRDSEFCDINSDWEFNIADVNSFNYKCLTEIVRWYDECDYNMDWKIDVGDMTSLIDVCMHAILEWNNSLLPICDFYKDWKLSVSDITTLQDTCQEKILQSESDSSENNNGANNLLNSCDLNGDKEVNIADINRFNAHCSVINWWDSNKCDLNNDREFNIADINVFNYTCLNGITWWTPANWSNNNWKDLPSVHENWYSQEMNNAYSFARTYWLTTKTSIKEAWMYREITRAETAKMISNYVKNVLGKSPETTKNCTFSDVTKSLDSKYDNWISEACQLWLMWQWIKNFRPGAKVTRVEFWTILSRALWWNKNEWWTKYYDNHLKALKTAWIMNKTNSTSSKVLRWEVMLMLQRSAK